MIITYEIAETAGIIDDGYIGKLNRELVEKFISESSSFDEVCQRIDAVGDYSVSNWGSGVRNIVYYAYKDGARDGFIGITLGGIKDTYISYNNVILCTPSDFVSENVE